MSQNKKNLAHGHHFTEDITLQFNFRKESSVNVMHCHISFMLLFYILFFLSVDLDGEATLARRC